MLTFQEKQGLKKEVTLFFPDARFAEELTPPFVFVLYISKQKLKCDHSLCTDKLDKVPFVHPNQI